MASMVDGQPEQPHPPLSAPAVITSMTDSPNAAPSATASSVKSTLSSAMGPVRDERPPGPACISTDGNRRPPREAPTGPGGPPQVARSNGVRPDEVAKFARSVKDKYRLASYYFPACGHKIGDLFDGEDIHVYGANFLNEVLTFITRENYYQAVDFANAWAANFPEYVKVVAAFKYDKNDKYAIVRRLFNEGQSMHVHPEFLWHVANIIRSITCEKPPIPARDEIPNKVAEGVAFQDLGCQVIAEDPKPEVERGPASQVGTKDPKLEAVSKPMAEHPPIANGPPLGVPTWSNMQSQGQVHMPPRQGPAPFAAGHPAGFPPEMHPPQPVHRLTVPEGPPGTYQNMRPMPARHRSSSIRTSSAPYMATRENQHMRHHPQSRHASGASVNSPMLNHASMNYHMNNGMGPAADYGQFPSNQSALSSPSLQPAYPHMMYQQHQLVTHSAPMPHTSQQAFDAGPMASRFQGPMGDMTNHGQYPSNPNMHRLNSIPNPRSVGRGVNDQPLYDPYGGQNREFNEINSSIRRGQRPNPAPTRGGRGRQSSIGSYRNNTPHNFNQVSGAIEYPPQCPPNRRHFCVPLDEDPDRGCNESFIGPKNEHVKELNVYELPSPVGENDVFAFFVERAGLQPASVRLQTDKNNRLYAKVQFSSVCEARLGLALNQTELRGHPVTVKVPKKYFDECRPWEQSAVAGQPSFSHSSQGGRGVSSAQPASKPPAERPTKTTYSPQDARSDLPPSQLGPSPAMGSPETRKPKKQNKSPGKKAKNAGIQEASKPQENAVIAATSALRQQTEHGLEQKSGPDSAVVAPLQFNEKLSPAQSNGATDNLENVSIASEQKPAASPKKQKLTTSKEEPKKVQANVDAGQAEVKKVQSPSTVVQEWAAETDHAKGKTPTAQPDFETQGEAQAAPTGPSQNVVESPPQKKQVDQTPPVSQIQLEPSPVEEASGGASLEEAEKKETAPDESATASKQGGGNEGLEDEAGSDDEQKHDSSFHSAKEAQSDDSSPIEAPELAKPAEPEKATAHGPRDTDVQLPPSEDATKPEESQVKPDIVSQNMAPPTPEIPSTEPQANPGIISSTAHSNGSASTDKKVVETQPSSIHPVALQEKQKKEEKRREKLAKRKEKKKGANKRKAALPEVGRSSTRRTEVSAGKDSGNGAKSAGPPSETSEGFATTSTVDVPSGGKENEDTGGKNHTSTAQPDTSSGSSVERHEQGGQMTTGASVAAHSSEPPEPVKIPKTPKTPKTPKSDGETPSKLPNATSTNSQATIKKQLANSHKVYIPPTLKLPVARSKPSAISSGPETPVGEEKDKLAFSESQASTTETTTEASQAAIDATQEAVDNGNPLSPEPGEEMFSTPMQTPAEQPKKSKPKKKKKKSANEKTQVTGQPSYHNQRDIPQPGADGDKAPQASTSATGKQAKAPGMIKNLMGFLQDKKSIFGGDEKELEYDREQGHKAFAVKSEQLKAILDAEDQRLMGKSNNARKGGNS